MINKVRCDERGFTLLELLVVIIIIGILISVVVPAYREQRKLAVDAATAADVRNIANLAFESMIGCENANIFDIKDSLDPNIATNYQESNLVTNVVKYTKNDGTVVGPFETYHTLTYDHWKTHQDSTIIRIYNTNQFSRKCLAQNVVLSPGTNIHLIQGSTLSSPKLGTFWLYGWNPAGKKYDGSTVLIESNYAKLTAPELTSVVTFSSELGGVQKQP